MKQFIFVIFTFCTMITAGHATTCVPKKGTAPDSARYLQYWDNTYLQCGGTGDKFYICNQNVVVEAWDGNLHKCTTNGWEIENGAPECSGSLDQIEQQYDGLSNLGTLASNKDINPQWLYYYNTNETQGYTAIQKYCKYNYTKFEQELNSCQDGFLSWNDDNTVTLCKSHGSATQPTSVTSSPKKQYREIACRDTGGDRYYPKNDKCMCNTETKHLKTITTNDGYSICQCVAGYKRNNETNEARGECTEADDYKTHEEFDSAQWRADTNAAYKHERDNAQSDANKALTAGSTLMTGEGAMMAARAIAERKADERAETEMAAYLTTLKCEYGGGQQVNLGHEETLPGGNELSNYYAEYKQLADKLKETKAALNLRPGIESEVLYDKAETGLYHYQTAEKQNGGFTSLANALMNPEGADAAAWNAQKAAVAQNLQTGTLLTAGGLVVGAAGNYIVNRNHKPLELKRKLNTIKTRLENEYPEIFIPTPEEPVVEEEVIEEEPESKQQPPIQPKTSKYAIDVFVDDIAFNPGHITLTSKAVEALKSAATEINELPNDGASISNISITTTGYTDPDPIKPAQIKNLTGEYTNTLGELPNSYGGQIDTNPKLSQARAEMVLSVIKDNISANLQRFLQSNAYGTASTDCKERKENYDKCRKVKIEITVQAEYAE